MSISCCIDKQIVVYLYKGILLSHIKGLKYWNMLHCGWISGTLFWIKETREKRLYNVWFCLNEIYGIGSRDREQGVGGHREWLLSGYGVFFWVDEMFLKSVEVVVV